MKLNILFLKKNAILFYSISIAIFTILVNSQSTNAQECSHTNFMIVDGECVNLDPQMKTEKRSKISNPISELDELTGSSIATYASLLSLAGGGVAGYKFLVRK